MLSHARILPAVAVVAALLVPLSSATAKPKPCAGKAASDEWPTFGRDLRNSRTQEEPGDIGADTAPLLAPVWSFSTGGAAVGLADFNGTPIVAAGCVFVNTAGGEILALDAETGEVVWRVGVPLDPGTTAGLGGIFVSSPAITNDLVIGLVNQTGGPYPIAVSRRDGEVVWRGEAMQSGDGYYTNATPVVHDGLVLAGYSPEEGDPKGRGGVAMYDVETGTLVARVNVVPDDAFAKGYAGAGVWTAPAVDTAGGYAYVGTGNPFSKTIEHEHTNAIVKIDVDRTRETFGAVVGSLKGNIEQYDSAFREGIDPVCTALGEDPNLQLVVGNSAPCLQLDLDFGAPPNLFTDGSGRLLIGDLQKSGVYHVADAETMDRAWSATVGVSCAACNAAASAWDGDSLFVASSPVDAMWSLEPSDGTPNWASPIGDGTHYQSVTTAGGAVFTIDNLGNLLAWDAATGVPLLRRPMAADVPDPSAPPVALSSSGLAVASGTVYVAAGNAVVAYRPAALP